MYDSSEHRDLLGIGQPTPFEPYQDDEGWTVVIPGCEERRKKLGKTVIALSKVEIRLNSEAERDTCVRHLEESDRRFAQVASNPWEWAGVRILENTVRFNVEWYEHEFFYARRTAFKDPDHIDMYAQFGATLEQITVAHFLVDQNGNEKPVD